MLSKWWISGLSLSGVFSPRYWIPETTSPIGKNVKASNMPQKHFSVLFYYLRIFPRLPNYINLFSGYKNRHKKGFLLFIAGGGLTGGGFDLDS